MTSKSDEPRLLAQLEMISTGSPHILNSPASAFLSQEGPDVDDIIELETAVIKDVKIRTRFLAALMQCVEFSRAHPGYLMETQLTLLFTNIGRCIPFSHVIRNLPTPGERTAFLGVVTRFVVAVSAAWKVSASKTVFDIFLTDVKVGLDQSPAENPEVIVAMCETGWNLANIAMSLPSTDGIEARRLCIGWVMQLLTRPDRSYASLSAGMLQRAYGFEITH